MTDWISANRRLWDKKTPVHAKSEFYDVDAFLKGKCTLNPAELKALGDVNGKTLLHLQCHFGLDSLSWARRGAQVLWAPRPEVDGQRLTTSGGRRGRISNNVH